MNWIAAEAAELGSERPRKRELVSELVGIARIAHGTEQLRDRIAYALSGVFWNPTEAPPALSVAEAELKQGPVATVYIWERSLQGRIYGCSERSNGKAGSVV